MSACVLDTDVVIAALDRRDAHHAEAADAITAMIDDDVALLLSLVNYAETLVKPAEAEETLRAAVDALSALGIRLVAPTPVIARDAARHRAQNIGLAAGFAIATARARGASLASFDQRVRRALPATGVELAPALVRDEREREIADQYRNGYGDQPQDDSFGRDGLALMATLVKREESADQGKPSS